MSEHVETLKRIMDLTTETLMWKQKASDLEKERDYLRSLLEEQLKSKAKGEKR